MMECQIDLDEILIKGAKYGNFDIVGNLINQGANIHAEDELTRGSLFDGSRSRYSCK
jgi:hypothetical protein